MANDTMTLQALMNQRDPFMLARQQSAAGGPTVEGPLMSGGPGMPDAMPMDTQMPQNTLSAVFKPQGGEPISDDKILGMFKKMGLDSQGLSLNSVGRFNLVNRLQSKYGPDYQKNPDIQNLMSTFDNYLKQNKDDKSKEMTDLNSKTNRTMDMIGQLG